MGLIKRKILPDILIHLSAPEITLITGARQVGKTTLMHEVKNILDGQNKKTLYFNLDFESDFYYFESQQKLMQKIELELGENRGYIFIDEIQRKENAGLFLKGLFDQSQGYKFIVSGSGSMELKEKIHESLTGRKRIFELPTITFMEFLHHKTGYKYEGKIASFFELEKERIDLILNEYLAFGGYPRIVTEPIKQEKISIINEIFDSYVKKDIVYLLKVDRPDIFMKLIRLLAHSSGSIVNYSSLATDVGISVPTLKKYLWYAENTFIIKTVHPFFKNKRKEITKSPTIYFNDLGLMNFALNQFGNEAAIRSTGYIFQNLIFLILKEVFSRQNYTVHYWRTTDKAEVDFVIDTGEQIIPIEVKFSQLKTDRVSRSYRNFINAYKPEKGYVVNLNYENEIRISGTKVKFIPFYKLYTEFF
ncbi:ATPase [candidate division KSB1 bacterium 4484_87]|nr:MAG: ATPase [candidate division KSB1 bacterium 4484_87]